MGIGVGARPRHARRAAQPHQGLPIASFFFSFTFRTPFSRSQVQQQNCRTHDATAREAESYVECPCGLYNEQYTCFTYHPVARSWRETCQIVLSLAYRIICIVLLLLQLFNKQCMLLPIIAFLFLICTCSLMTCCIRTIWYGQIH